MINNITDMLINMTNTTAAPGTADSTDHREGYAILGIIGCWIVGVSLFIATRKGYEAIRDDKCNPCGLFTADTTTPMHERTYLNLDSNGPVAGFA